MSRPRLVCHPKFSESILLQDLYGIREDLEQVLVYLELIEAQIVENSRKLALWEGLTCAAAVSYSRCFSSGVRKQLEPSILDDAPALISEMHNFVLALRNKYFAHSVNAYEENRLAVSVGFIDHAPAYIEAIDIRSVRVLALSDPEIPKFRSLTEWMLEKVSQKFIEEEVRLMQFLQALPLDSITKHSQEPIPKFIWANSHLKSRERG